jgi:hypothetical protein
MGANIHFNIKPCGASPKALADGDRSGKPGRAASRSGATDLICGFQLNF